MKNSVIVSTTGTSANHANLIKVEPITDKIIRVSAMRSDSFPNVQSLMIEPKLFPKVRFHTEELGNPR